ncbi:MAG: hypothetical protein IPJ34_40925 [Myxococcales bacterium]|nr:hypothetical protein [Myxococcales bacterium]
MPTMTLKGAPPTDSNPKRSPPNSSILWEIVRFWTSPFISKSDKPFWALLQEVHEFKRGTTQRADWEKALLLTPSMTEPTDVNFADLVKLIRERDAAMRRELAEFMGGTLTRRDI